MRNPKYKNGFKFTMHRDAIDLPLRWNRPRKIFVNSMSDLFHERMPDNYLLECFEVMEKADWHVYQILTKRPQRMLEFSKNYGHIPDHIWLGTSVELGLYKFRINILRKVKVKTRFVSFEPLLGPMGRVNLRGISWAIVGGESGKDHRQIRPEWVRDLRDQCKSKGVAFFFKQWGGLTSRSGGRKLDRKIWSEYPRYLTQENGTSRTWTQIPVMLKAD